MADHKHQVIPQTEKVRMKATQQQLGYPIPELYDQYYIHNYSFPKGLQTQRR